MSKKRIDVDQRVEEIFQAFANEMGESMANYAEALLDENQPDPPLFVEKTEPVFGAETPIRRSRHILRRTLVLVAVLILIMAMVVVTSEGVRLKLSSLIFGDAPASTRVIDDSNLVVDLEDIQLGYVPEGFEVESEEMVTGYCRLINYADSNDNFTVFSATKTERYVNNIDDERSEVEKILINDKQGYYFYDESHHTIIWQMGDCTCQITSPIEKREVVKVAEHLIIR